MKGYFVFMLFPPCSPDLLLFQSGPKQLKIRRLFQWRGRLRVWTLQRWQTSDKPNIVFAAIGKSGTVYHIGHKGIELRTPKFTKMRRFQEGEGEGGDEIKWRFKKKKKRKLLLSETSTASIRIKVASVLATQLLNPKIIIYSRYNCRQVFQRFNPPSK